MSLLYIVERNYFFMNIKLLVALVIVAPIFAQAQVHEVSGNTNAGIGLTKGNSTGLPIAASNTSNTFQLSLGIGYAYLFADGLQLATDASATYMKVGPVNDKDFALAVGANYNVGNLLQAYYVGVRGVYDHSPDYNFGVKGLIGKRISLASNITWNPEVSFSKFFKATKPWTFDIKVINLALHF